MNENLSEWTEWVKLLCPVLTPVVAALFGWLILRRVENIRNTLSRSSDFRTKWANEFFDVYNKFIGSVVKTMVLFNQVQQLRMEQ